jgi:hypothetical protein
MTLQEFIAKYNLQGVDTDGAFGFQCMDLMHRYCMDVLGLNSNALAAPAAKDVWLSNVPSKEKFEAIANTPTNTPLPGDIILWGTGIGPYGHVAIVQKANVNDFTSFDQNFPTGTKSHLQNHTYKGVLGWLRYKGGGNMANMYGGLDLSNPESMKPCVDLYNKWKNGGFVERPLFEVIEREVLELRKRPESCPPAVVDPKAQKAVEILNAIKGY